MDWIRQKLEYLRGAEGYVVPAGNGASGRLKETLGPLKLDANENHFIARAWLEELAQQTAGEVDPRLYSVAEIAELKAALADQLDVPPQRIVLGCGADQLIDFLAATFLRGATAAAACLTPSYSFYRIRAALHGATMLEIPLDDDFGFPAEAALRDAAQARLFFLCSPNNPTGRQFDRDQVLDFVDRFPGLVIVDEAYADFAPYQLSKEVRDEGKLIVLRTLSKSYGLAGLRVGYLVAPSPLAEVFIEKVQYPYPLGQSIVRLATKVVQATEKIREATEAMKKERDRLSLQLGEIPGIRVFPSDANFVLFHWRGDEKTLHQKLHDRGIHIKYIGQIAGQTGYLRATVGTEPMNRRLIDTLARLTAEVGESV